MSDGRQVYRLIQPLSALPLTLLPLSVTLKNLTVSAKVFTCNLVVFKMDISDIVHNL